MMFTMPSVEKLNQIDLNVLSIYIQEENIKEISHTSDDHVK